MLHLMMHRLKLHRRPLSLYLLFLDHLLLVLVELLHRHLFLNQPMMPRQFRPDSLRHHRPLHDLQMFLLSN
jgi:hypothetical protein